MNKSALDKLLETKRYDERALENLSSATGQYLIDGALTLPYVLRAPYLKYETYIEETIKKGDRILELAAGTGEFSRIFMREDIQYTASDISSISLEVLKKRFNLFIKLL